MTAREVFSEDATLSAAGSAKPAESIRLRYFVTLITQCLQLLVSVVTAGIVPKALGPIVFGNYSFLMSMASTIRSFTDLGAQQTFFTFSAKEARSGTLTRMYGIWVLVQLLLSLSLVLSLALCHRTQALWPGQHLNQILWVTGLEWAVFLVLVLRNLGDAKGLTVRSQLIVGTTALVSAVGLVVLDHSVGLTFYSYVALLYAMACLGGGALSIYLVVYHRELTWVGSVRRHAKRYIHQWRIFASPLVVYGLYSVAVNAVDGYLIQRLYGPTEQAFFSIALRWSSLVMVFTTSILTIYWRELTSSLAAHRRDRAAEIFVRFNHLLFFLAVVLGCWLCANARWVVLTFAGPQYQLAIPVLMIMGFYPVQQTYGQLNATAFLASERTAQYRNLGILFSIPGLLLTYFLLASRHARIPGLELGAVGIAFKMVVFGLISVQAYDWLNARYFQISYGRSIAEKLLSVVFVAVCALVVFRGAMLWPAITGRLGETPRFFVGSIFYFAVILTGVIWRPKLAGLRKTDIPSMIQMIKSLLQPPDGPARSNDKIN
jgi:O-antigen/teichoic acid export membrane protein